MSLRKPKLKISSSNTKNFPKDFFSDVNDSENDESLASICQHKSFESVFSSRKLRPLKLNSKLMRIQSPSIKPVDPSFWSTRSIAEIDLPTTENKTKDSREKRRAYNKSMSLNRHRDFSMSREETDYNKNGQSGSDSPVIHLNRIINKNKVFLNNSQKAMIFRRPKSIDKKSLLNRRNIQNLMLIREKNISSANNNIQENNLGMRSANSCSLKQPKILLSQQKFNNSALYNIIEHRNRQKIRPFCLFPETAEQSNGSKNTRNFI